MTDAELKEALKRGPDLDYIKHAMELHDKNMEKGINDFLPVDRKPTWIDRINAKRVERYFRRILK